MVIRNQFSATVRSIHARLLFPALLFFISAGSRPPGADLPEAVITNGLVSAKLYLPDKENGYYRGARFDWAGVISSLEYKNHSYFGKWFEKYDPFLHDAIMGPVDEFRTPLGFDEAGPGEEFVKVGVGLLRKPDGKPYSFVRKYEMTGAGEWQTDVDDSQVTFSQKLKSSMGYAYLYEKVVKLIQGEPRLVIAHRLTNTGSLPITTNTYNHNFFMIDREPTGPGIFTTFGFDIAAEGSGFGDIAHAKDRSLTFTRQLQKGEHVFSDNLKAVKDAPAPYSFTVENRKTGAGVRVTGSKPVDTMIYWACPTTACPEPYIDISLKPGEATEWSISYEFYAKP